MKTIANMIRENLDNKLFISISVDDVSPAAQRDIQRIVGYEHDWYPPYTFDWRAQTEGGKLTKRIKSELYRITGEKLSDEHMQTIGNLAQRSRFWRTRFDFIVARGLHWRAGEFGDGDSCYWGSKNYMRNILNKNHNIFSVLIYQDEDFEMGWGRAILLLDFPKKGAIVAVNAYPKGFQITNISRLLAKWVHINYGVEPVTKKITMHYDGSWREPVWINGGNGASVSINPLSRKKYNTREYFRLNVCTSCNKDKDRVVVSPSGDTLCLDCFDKNWGHCAACDSCVEKAELFRLGSLSVCSSCNRSRFRCHCDKETLQLASVNLHTISYTMSHRTAAFGVRLFGVGPVCTACAIVLYRELHSHKMNLPPDGIEVLDNDYELYEPEEIGRTIQHSHAWYQEVKRELTS